MNGGGAPPYILTPAHSFNPRAEGTILKNILWEERVGFGLRPKRRGQGGGETHKYAGRQAGVTDKCDLQGLRPIQCLTGKPIRLILPSYNTHQWTLLKMCVQ